MINIFLCLTHWGAPHDLAHGQVLQALDKLDFFACYGHSELLQVVDKNIFGLEGSLSIPPAIAKPFGELFSAQGQVLFHDSGPDISFCLIPRGKVAYDKIKHMSEIYLKKAFKITLIVAC